jgi:uncharacterized protein YegJ (DUF2314 family)
MVTKSFIIRQDSAFNIVGIRVHLPSESAFNIRRRTQQERVWVQVQSVNHNKIVGVLDNDPVYADVRFGQQIEIELRHVLGIERLVSGSLRLGQNP